jgi:predicted RND superfamily exporter protein
MIGLIRFSVHHPWLVLAAIAMLTLPACLFMPRVRLQLDARSLIPSGDPRLNASDDAARLFGLRDVVVIGIVNEDSGIYVPDTLRRIARLSKALSEVNGVAAESVMSLATVSTQGMKDGQIISSDLLAKNRDLDQKTARQLQADVERLGLANGILVSKDGRTAAIIAGVMPEANRYDILQQIRTLLAVESGGKDTLYLTGTALAQAVLGQSAARDLARLVPAVIIVVGIVLMFAFRHPAPAAFSLLEIGISLLWTIGVMGIGEQSVFVTTLVLPVILISVGVSDDVYALTHYFNHQHRAIGQSFADGVIEAFSHIIRPVGVTAISTIIGMLSLAVTSLEPLRVFGIYGAIAILFSTLFTVTLIPALLVTVRPRLVLTEKHHNSWDGPIRRLFGGLIAAGPRHLLVLLLVVTGSSALLVTRLQVDDSWIANLPADSDIARGDKVLNERLAGTTTVDLLIDNGQVDGYLRPQTFASLGAVEDAVAALPFVGAVESVYSDVARTQAAVAGVDYAEYRQGLQFHVVPLTRDRIEQTIKAMASAAGSLLNERLDNSYRQARLTVFVRSANYRRIESVLQTARAAGASISRSGGSITPFGDGWISYVTVQLLVKGQLLSIPLALLTDFILLSIVLRSIRTGLLALLPVALSVLVVFATLAAATIPLGIANSMFAGIAIGIGLDFSIHLTTSYWQGVKQGLEPVNSLARAFASTGPPIITSAIAIASGFSVLALSEVAANLQLGLIISLALLVCAAITLVLIPSLLLVREKPVIVRRNTNLLDIK